MGEKSILVVEDERIVAMDLRMRLEGLGYSVAAIASSGKEAIKEAEGTLPDLVLMDIVLRGGMDGIEAAGEISNRLGIPVVYVSAYSDVETLRRAKVSGPFGYIVKPFDDRQLQANIEIALHKHSSDKALRESEERFKRLAEATSEGILVHDDGLVLDLNNRLAQMLGYDPRELLGKDIFGAAMPGYRDAVNLSDWPGLQGLLELEMRRKDGSTFPAEITIQAIPYRDKKVKVAAIRDITFRKQVEKLMKEKARGELYGFVVSALPLIAPGALQEVRADLLGIFAGHFEEFFKPGFAAQMRRQGFEGMPTGDEALSAYLTWASELFSSFGINVAISQKEGRGQMELRNCPWITYARKNAVFCILCRAMASRSFSWVSPHGAMGLSTTIAGGRQSCGFEFKPLPAGH
jgi:PAS domain S-box-containing protein